MSACFFARPLRHAPCLEENPFGPSAPRVRDTAWCWTTARPSRSTSTSEGRGPPMGVQKYIDFLEAEYASWGKHLFDSILEVPNGSNPDQNAWLTIRFCAQLQ